MIYISKLQRLFVSFLQCGKDLSEEVAKLRLSLADAEVLGIETKKEWAVLRTENIALEELKVKNKLHKIFKLPSY